MTTDPSDVGALIPAISENAEALGLKWQLRPATTMFNSNGIASVRFDGDTAEINARVVPLVDNVVAGDRVMVLIVPPSSNYIIGKFTALPSGSGWAVAFGGTNPTTTSTTYTALAGGDVLGVAFNAPASGSVEVLVQGWLALSSATLGRRALMAPEIREGSVVNSGTVVAAASDDYAALAQNSVASSFDYKYVNHSRIVTGLTPGADYNAVVMHRVVTAADNSAANDRHVIVKPFG